MLIALHLCQLALIDELTVTLGPGLTVLTGETGAGKSLIAGALSLLSGGRAPKDWVRLGEEVAFVEGVFDLAERPAERDHLQRLGIRVGADGILVLRRELRRQGRGRVLINGLVSSLALLEQIGPRLLSIQSQDQQHVLADPDHARRLLDQRLEHEPLLAELRSRMKEFHQRHTLLQERLHEQEVAAEQLDLWTYQHQELVEARLRSGEEEQLAEELLVKRHASTLQECAGAALRVLTGEEAAARDQLGAAIGALRPAAGKSQKLADVLTALQAAQDATNEVAMALERFLDGLDLDPAGLEELESRKALYEEMRRKYGRDTAGLLALRASLQERIARHRDGTADLKRQRQELDEARRRLQDAAQRIHLSRQQGAATVAAEALERIRPLALPSLELEFRITARTDPEGPIRIDDQPCLVGPGGADHVELLARTNPGERMAPVATVASGGERSRIHLGLVAMAETGPRTPLLLFDEIDAGIGMDAAKPVADLLASLARRGQVVCITHLATLAVQCDANLKVEKSVAQGRTLLAVRSLNAQERLDEVARLLGGEHWDRGDGTAQRAYARQLLRRGQKERLAGEQ